MTVELSNVVRIEDPTGPVYYLGTLRPAEIKQLTFVPVVTRATTAAEEEGLNEKDGGYQRAGDMRRMKQIGRFVRDRPSCLVPPVVLCARGGWTFVPSGSNKSFGKLVAGELAAIIDGQHRLGGLWHVARDDTASQLVRDKPVPFMVVDDMSVDLEKREFVDINDNQKGVKKSLLRYLGRGHFTGQAAEALMDDEESVFKGRIDVQKKNDWTIFLFGAAEECVGLMFGRDFVTVRQFDPIRDQSNQSIQEAALEFVLRYWRTVADAMPEFWSDIELMPPFEVPRSKEKPGTRAFRWRLLEETGIRAFSQLAADLFRVTWVDGVRAPSWELLEKYLRELSARENVSRALTKPKRDPAVLEWDGDLKSTGKAGVAAIYKWLRNELDEVMQDRG